MKFSFLLACVLVLSPLPASADTALSTTVPVTSSPITAFKLNSTQTVFGKLEFNGGIQMSSTNPLLGALSSIRFRPDKTHFVAVMDTGHWVEGAIERDAAGKLSGLSDLTVTSMIDRQGRSERVKRFMDSEGVALREGQVIASYEGLHRVDVYPDPGFTHSRPLRTLPILIAPGRLSSNGSLETVAVAPPSSALAGGVVIVAEASTDKAGKLYAAVLDGPRKGQFTVVRKEPFAVTDGAFLPDGDLLLLERRFSFATGIGMQIRRIAGDSIRPGAVVDGEVLLQADMSNQIDNMEGLDVIVQPNGDIHLIVISDDNHSILERNLMLEFKLLQ